MPMGNQITIIHNATRLRISNKCNFIIILSIHLDFHTPLSVLKLGHVQISLENE